MYVGVSKMAKKGVGKTLLCTLQKGVPLLNLWGCPEGGFPSEGYPLSEGVKDKLIGAILGDFGTPTYTRTLGGRLDY